MAELHGIPVRRLDTIEPPENGCFSFGLIGSTRSGKSVAMLWIQENFFKEHVKIMMTGSSQAAIYKPLQKSTAVSPAFYPELIKESMKINQMTDNKYKILHIFDDMLDSKQSKIMAKLLCIGRNCGHSTVICAQELTILNSIGRTNFNYMLLFRLNSMMSVEKVVKNYLRHILPGKLDEQIKLYCQLTEDHYFFCVDFLANKTFLCKLDLSEVPGQSGSG